MRSGAILDRSGKAYKPKTVRSYEHALENHIYPLLGSRKVSSLRAPAAAGSRSISTGVPGRLKYRPETGGKHWGHLGASMTGFRMPPAAPSG